MSNGHQYATLVREKQLLHAVRSRVATAEKLIALELRQVCQKERMNTAEIRAELRAALRAIDEHDGIPANPPGPAARTPPQTADGATPTDHVRLVRDVEFRRYQIKVGLEEWRTPNGRAVISNSASGVFAKVDGVFMPSVGGKPSSVGRPRCFRNINTAMAEAVVQLKRNEVAA